ncbi:hypothetical protein PG985_008516 [Apiospora marii]|uniref:uncharacterized protein n=1 Tax=Apiospora marii TaxID=335849 RepID=UPI00312DB865
MKKALVLHEIPDDTLLQHLGGAIDLVWRTLLRRVRIGLRVSQVLVDSGLLDRANGGLDDQTNTGDFINSNARTDALRCRGGNRNTGGMWLGTNRNVQEPPNAPNRPGGYVKLLQRWSEHVHDTVSGGAVARHRVWPGMEALCSDHGVFEDGSAHFEPEDRASDDKWLPKARNLAGWLVVAM